MTNSDTGAFELPIEAAESIAITYLKLQLEWMKQQLETPQLFEEDTAELIKDITAVRRVVWWMTGDFSYDDAAE